MVCSKYKLAVLYFKVGDFQELVVKKLSGPILESKGMRASFQKKGKKF